MTTSTADNMPSDDWFSAVAGSMIEEVIGRVHEVGGDLDTENAIWAELGRRITELVKAQIKTEPEPELDVLKLTEAEIKQLDAALDAVGELAVAKLSQLRALVRSII